MNVHVLFRESTEQAAERADTTFRYEGMQIAMMFGRYLLSLEKQRVFPMKARRGTWDATHPTCPSSGQETAQVWFDTRTTQNG